VVKRIAIFFACLFMFLLSISATADELGKYEYTRNGYQATMLQKHWDSFDHTHSGFDTPQDFLQYAVDAMERIVQWGGGTKKLNEYREAGNEVILSVQFTTTSGMSHVVSSNYGKEKQMAIITLKDNYLAYRIAPIIHELTHVVYPIGYSRTLREGLASYVHDELSEYGTVHNFGMNPHEICQNVILPLESNQNLLKFVGAIDSGKTTTNEQRASFYVASQSFMTYLIETYGIEASMGIYSSMSEDAYEEQTGKTLEEIRTEWVLYLKEYESDFSAETIRKYTYNLAIEHGIPEDGAVSFADAAYHRFVD